MRVRLQADAGRILEGCYVSGLRAGHEPRYAHTFKAFQDIFRKAGRTPDLHWWPNKTGPQIAGKN